MTPENRLWQAVIVKAVLDAISKNDFEFFDLSRRHFRWICEAADFDAEWIFKAIKEKQNWPRVESLRYLQRIKRGLHGKRDIYKTDFAEILEFENEKLS
jgi:hypothetical protein